MSPPPIDRGYAWIIVLATAIPQMIYLGVSKSGGLLLVEIMETFNATSSQAAVMFTLADIVNSIASLLVLTVLEPRIQKRLLVMIGGFLFGLGLISGFFSTHFLHVVIPYGICAGLGKAFMYGPQMIMLRQYFECRQAVAFGVAVSGPSVGAVIIPILFRHLLKEYGFHGAMLLMGGISLHCIIFGSLLRPIESYSTSQPLHNVIRSPSVDILETADRYPGDNGQLSLTAEICMKDQVNILHCDKSGMLPTQDSALMINNVDDVASVNGVKSYEPSNTLYQEQKDVSQPCLEVGGSEVCMLESLAMDVVVKQIVDAKKATRESSRDTEHTKHLLDEDKDIELESDRRSLGTEIECLSSLDIATSMTSLNIPMQQQAHEDSGHKRKLLDLSLLKQPAFLAYLIFASFCNVGPWLTLIFIPPHGRDLGFAPHQTDILISITGVGDLLGRLFLGVVAQTGVIKRHNLLTLSMLIVGATQHISRFLVTYWALIVDLSIYSLFAGSFYVLGPLVVADFFSIKMMPNAMGIMLLSQGFSYSAVIALCAWIRDQTGSYAVCFHLIGSLTIVGGIVLFIIPRWCTLQDRRSK